MLPPHYICPTCGIEGTLKAQAVFRHQLPLSPSEPLGSPAEPPDAAIVEKIFCGSCDFSIDINVIHVARLKQPTCQDCKLSSDCAASDAARYVISAHLCPDFRWKTSSAG